MKTVKANENNDMKFRKDLNLGRRLEDQDEEKKKKEAVKDKEDGLYESNDKESPGKLELFTE